MSIPKYFEMYQSFLECLKDGQPHSIKEIKNIVAEQMNVSEEERKQLLPSGKQPLFDNRIGWTRTYLKKAGVIFGPARGISQLTDLGKELLKNVPTVIDDRYLYQNYVSFRSFKTPEALPEESIPVVEGEDTPQDTFDKAFAAINDNLAEDLLSEVMKQPPEFFEHLVVQLLERMGYGGTLKEAGIVTGQTGDEGIDGIIKEDKLGFSLIYIQAKRWDAEKTIGRPEIQKFVGALAGQGATKGLFITTAKFTKEAIQYADKQHTTKVVLVDGVTLTRLMIEYNLGVSVETVYQIKRLDTDFFVDGDI